MKKKNLFTIFITVMMAVLLASCASLQKTSNNQALTELEILELISMYSYYYDGKNAEDLSQIFSEDALWVWYRADGTKVVEIQTRPNLKGFFQQSFDERLKTVQTRHFQTNTVFIELTGKTAKTKTMVLPTAVLLNGKVDFENSPTTAYQGIYEDEFLKTGGGWKIKVRKLTTDN